MGKFPSTGWNVSYRFLYLLRNHIAHILTSLKLQISDHRSLTRPVGRFLSWIQYSLRMATSKHEYSKLCTFHLHANCLSGQVPPTSSIIAKKFTKKIPSSYTLRMACSSTLDYV